MTNYFNEFALPSGSKMGSYPASSPEAALNPWFITGFVDGEGSFTISILRVKDHKLGWRVNATFQMCLHKKDIALLEQMKSYFGVGSIHKHGPQSVQFRVFSVKDLEVFLKHFDTYSLITQKCSDFELFKEAFTLILNKEHLTIEGLRKIVAIKASMNKGLSEELKAAFPNILPVPRPSVLNSKIKDPNWLAGFTSGEGSFIIKVHNSLTILAGLQVLLKFQLTQHIRDEELMKSLVEYFGCGKYRERKNGLAGDFEITKFTDLVDKVIPFFVKYPIQGVKRLDYLDWCKVAEMMQNKEHLTAEGLSKIRKIKAGINKGRLDGNRLAIVEVNQAERY